MSTTLLVRFSQSLLVVLLAGCLSAYGQTPTKSDAPTRSKTASTRAVNKSMTTSVSSSTQPPGTRVPKSSPSTKAKP